VTTDSNAGGERKASNVFLQHLAVKYVPKGARLGRENIDYWLPIL